MPTSMSSAPPHHHHRPSQSCRWTLRPFCNTQPAGASPLRPLPALPALCTEYARDCDNSSRETCDVDPLAGTIITWKEAVRHSRNCANSFPIGTEPASILEQGYLGVLLYFPNEATSLRTRLPWSRRPGSTHESLLFSPYHSTRQYIHTHIHNSATHAYDPSSFHGADHPGATIRWRMGRECASDRLGHRHQHRPCHRIVACRATNDGCNRWSWLWPESTLACPAHAEYEDHIDTDTDASIATHVCCVAQPATPLTPPTTTFAPRLE